MVVNQNKQYGTRAKYETSQMQSKDEILKNSSEDVENLVKQFRRQSSRFEDEFTFTPRQLKGEQPLQSLKPRRILPSSRK